MVDEVENLAEELEDGVEEYVFVRFSRDIRLGLQEYLSRRWYQVSDTLAQFYVEEYPDIAMEVRAELPEEEVLAGLAVVEPIVEEVEEDFDLDDESEDEESEDEESEDEESEDEESEDNSEGWDSAPGPPDDSENEESEEQPNFDEELEAEEVEDEESAVDEE